VAGIFLITNAVHRFCRLSLNGSPEASASRASTNSSTQIMSRGLQYRPMRFATLLLVALMLVTARAQERYDDAGLTFTRAYIRGNAIDFESPIAVDWEATARRHYGAARLANPARDEIRKYWREVSGATFEYDIPVPERFRGGYFYLIAESGSGFLQLTKLIGSVSYDSDEQATRISPPSFSGTVRGVGSGSLRPADAGFVVYSAARPTVTRIDGLASRTQEPRLSVVQNGNENVFTLMERGRTLVIDRKPVKYPTLQSASVLTFGTATYLFIRWAPDTNCIEACCEHAYSLYRIDAGAKTVLENFYDCDV